MQFFLQNAHLHGLLMGNTFFFNLICFFIKKKKKSLKGVQTRNFAYLEGI